MNAATQAMNEATQRMAKYSLWSTVLIGIGTALLIATLYYTRQANKAAITAANAAREGNENFMKIARIETRAYFSVEPKGIIQLIGTNEVMGHVQVKNVGKLPARNVSVYVRMEKSPEPEPEHSDRKTNFIIIDKTRPNTERVIQPGGTMRQGSEDRFHLAQIVDLPRGHNIYVWGIVYYNDGHGCPRFTRFAHRYSLDSANTNIDRTAPASKSIAIIEEDKARYHTYGNEAD